jgi:hypothetical protein
MGQPLSGGRVTVTRSYRRDLGGAWWAALVVVTVALGLVGRGAGGFWSVFLWSVVGFVLGSLVALFVAARVVPASSKEEAFESFGEQDGSADRGGDDGRGVQP